MIKIDKRVLIPTAVFLIVFLFATATIAKQMQTANTSLDVIRTDTPIVFYFGVTCPHCKEVEKFIEENGVAEKVKFSQKEVYKNKENANEALEKAAICGIAKDKLGVPFLFDGEKCYVGKDKIIDFFNEKINEK